MNQKDIEKLLRARDRVEAVKEYRDAQERRIRQELRDRIINGNFDTVILAARTKIKRNRLNNYISGTFCLTIQEIEAIYNELKFPVTRSELAERKHKPCWKNKIP